MNTIDKARELGVALANSPEFMRLSEARERVDANAAVTDLIQEFRNKESEIVSMMEDDDVDREGVVILTSDIERIKEQLLTNQLFTELVEAQQAFSNLLSAVNREINVCIGIEEPEETACSGSCDGCRGCAH